MKSGQLTENNKINFADNEAGRLIPDPFSLFKKALYEAKVSGLQVKFNIFR